MPFGRLQPYVGIGPGLVVMYDQQMRPRISPSMSMAGIRYMMLKNVSAFVEYKYNHQFDAEMETHSFRLQRFAGGRQAAIFAMTCIGSCLAWLIIFRARHLSITEAAPGPPFF